MDKLILPITKSARRFGYIIWSLGLNEQMKAFLMETSHVHLIFRGIDLGEKKVDWKYRRISIGYKWTRRLEEDVSQYVLTFLGRNGNKLIVECQ